MEPLNRPLKSSYSWAQNVFKHIFIVCLCLKNFAVITEHSSHAHVFSRLMVKASVQQWMNQACPWRGLENWPQIDIQNLLFQEDNATWCGLMWVWPNPHLNPLLVTIKNSRVMLKERRSGWFVRFVLSGVLLSAGISELTEEWQLLSADISCDRTYDSELSHHPVTQVRH